MEPIMNFDWNILGYAVLMIYHFIFLQILSVVRFCLFFTFQYVNLTINPLLQPTQVNLNHMLCPAILDPFEGQNYRIGAVIHQGILCPLLCKIISFLFTPRNFTTDITTSNNNHQKQSAHTANAPSTTMTPKSNKTTANGNHRNLVNSKVTDTMTSDMCVNAISRDKKNCADSELFLSKDVKID